MNTTVYIQYYSSFVCLSSAEHCEYVYTHAYICIRIPSRRTTLTPVR